MADIRKRQPDFWLLLSVILLVLIGTVMVCSASPAAAKNSKEGNSYTFIIKQLVFVALGFATMAVAYFINFEKVIKKFTILFFSITLVLLGLVLTPLGVETNGAQRWLNVGFDLQPSEFFKTCMILFIAYMFSHPKIKERARGLGGLLLIIAPVAAGMVLIFLQPHVSCLIILGIVMVAMMVFGRLKIYMFGLLGGGIAGAGLAAYALVPHVQKRINSFLGSGNEANSSDKWQATQSLYAIGSGGLFGVGLGKSMQKQLYLPEPYNDFIFAILAEELGFVGCVVVILLFMLLVWRGYKTAMYAKDAYSALVAAGLTTLIATQFVLNIAVVTNILPVTGVSLPFFSYGGTSLMTMMLNAGLLLNISRDADYIKF
ncbi:MAG: putative lipid II flippase FtsW [Ruminococcaceae bacterium]|nr:putative lipid II flippase FtsW [Oscillospiraceae bacterium]